MLNSTQKVALADELLADIELNRLRGQELFLKALRLARSLENEGLENFIKWELHGYPAVGTHESVEEMLRLTGRLGTGDEKTPTLYRSLGELVAWAELAEVSIAASKLDSVSGEMALLVTKEAQRSRNVLLVPLVRTRQVESSVVAWLHDLVSHISDELAFSSEQASLFSQVQGAIDARLSTMGGTALEKIEAIYERLEDGGQEAVSHALTSCRRLIKAVADALYPARQEPIRVDGHLVKVTDQEPLNRIETFVSDHTSSRSRRKRLRRALEEIYDRTSAGVHTDVSPDEARHIFLQTYVLLGEIVLLDR